MSRFFSLILFLLLISRLQAQKTGWDLIRENDFVGARPAFEAVLKQHPDDEEALTGMIFLAETVQDYETYQRYVNRLMTADWAAPYVWLFGHLYGGAPEEALRQRLPESLRLPFLGQQADSLLKYRRFAESRALRMRIVPDWQWAITGPFSNVGGSGFLETTAVENTPFDRSARFRSEEGVEFGWLPYRLHEPGAPLEFHHLPGGDGLATYYAQTFLTVPTARRAELRLSRTEPVKIWLDDRLLLESPRPLPQLGWDQEILTFELPAGTHRLLIKVAEFPAEPTDSPVLLEYNDTENEGNDGVETQYASYADDESGTPRRRVAETGLVIRLTDPQTGEPFADLTTSLEGPYRPAAQPWAATLRDHEYFDHFRRQLGQSPDGFWRHYLLVKAFIRAGMPEEGEAFYASALMNADPEARRQAFLNEPLDRSAFFKFLLAKLYDANNKAERAEALLSELDGEATPTFAGEHLRLMKINKDQDEATYLAALEHILGLSPTNWKILSRYLRFLEEKGRRTQIQGYVQGFLHHHNTPFWKKRLEKYLKDESYRPESFKSQTDRDREKAFKKTRNRVKKTFSQSDYNALIQYYKDHDRVQDVLRTYDELLEVLPWNDFAFARKADYLFEIGRTDEALALLRSRLEIRPYDGSLYETIGDIHIEKKEPAEALRWYRLAQKLQGGSEAYALGGKIEKIENRRTYTGYFPPVSLEEAAKDRSWLERYGDEEAVVSLFTQQITYLRDEKRLESVRKAVIHIRSEAGAKMWTEADLRQLGTITSARVLKKDGTSHSPDLGWGMAVFKNLQAGDVILVEGTSDNSLPEEIPGELLDLNVLSWPAPVARASLDLLLPKDQDLHVACNRLDCNYTTRDSGEFKLLRWQWNDVAKIEEEEATPDNLDGAAWIMFGSVSDWSRVVQWYDRKTYCRTEPNYEVLAKARELIRPGMTPEQVVETLHTFITRDINYSFVPFLNNNYVPKKPGATLSGKVGDCKDVATLMITLLREQGIPAWYTLVSTHSFSNREPRPTLFVFNHAIVAYQLADGVLRFADLTTDYFPNGVLPESDCDAWALVIRDGEKSLRRLPDHLLDPATTRVEIRAQARLDADGNLTLETETRRYGTAAGQWREWLLRATADDRRKKLSEYFGGGVLAQLDVEAADFANLDSINAPLQARVRLKAFHQLDKVSNLYILPAPLPLSTPTQKALFAARRYNDLDLDLLFELAPVRETVDLQLPPGYVLAEMPEARRISGRFGDYSLTFERIDGGLRIRREVTFKERFVDHADFEEFKKFYLGMLDGDDAFLALRKVGTR